MYDLKREIIKNVIIIGFILMIAVVSTHHIYYKYKAIDEVSVVSNKLDTVFHEKTGENIDITKVVPVADSVGLSSNAYTFTVTNDSEEPVKYKIQLVDNADKIIEEDCKEYLIGKQFIKVSIKVGKENQIYTLEDLENGILLSDELSVESKKNYSIRIWIDKDITLPYGSNLHYHGNIKVIEE